MSKKAFNEAPFSVEEVTQYLENYSDFSFEVKTLSLLNASGFTCSHSGTYTDPITGKTREYDIRASKVVEIWPNVYYDLQLPLECKNIKPYSPLVVHRLPRRREEATHDLIINTGNSRGKLRMPPSVSLYTKGQQTGKSADQLKRNDTKILGSDSEVFDKVSQALSSAYDIIQSAVVGAGAYRVASVIPILVVPTGTLWVIDYDENGKVVDGPKAVEQTSYYCGKTWNFEGQLMNCYTLTHLEIVTFDFLQEFLRLLIVDRHDLAAFLTTENLL